VFGQSVIRNEIIPPPAVSRLGTGFRHRDPEILKKYTSCHHSPLAPRRQRRVQLLGVHTNNASGFPDYCLAPSLWLTAQRWRRVQ
jgi:hypothetical protein